MEDIIYTKEQYEDDEKRFSESESSGKVDWSAFSRLMIHDLATNTNVITDHTICDVRLEDIQKAMRNPKNGWRLLLHASDLFMRISPHYYRLNNLFSNMALCCWWLDIYDVKNSANISALKKQYMSLAGKLEGMNLKHEFSKIMKMLPYQDIYCGLVAESQNDFFFQHIDFRICKIHQVQDGLYNFKINLSSIKANELGAYPDYVQEAYIDFIEGNSTEKWYSPPSDLQICIKMNSQWLYPFPMLIGVIRDILDLDIYKKLKLQSARTDNYKAIAIKVPIDEKAVDKPLVSPDFLGMFAEINRESMNDDIGIIHTLGSTGEPISFKDSTNTRNNVGDAIDEIYNSAGETIELFNGSSSGTAVTFSVENDAGFVYSVYRQFERWVNRYIKARKFNKPNYKFLFYMLDITIFNRDNVSKRYKEAVTLGASVIDKWMASIDMTPSRMLGSYIVNKDIFDFNNNFVPLATSYNGTVENSEAGRPTNESKGETLDVEGEKTKDGEKNDL